MIPCDLVRYLYPHTIQKHFDFGRFKTFMYLLFGWLFAIWLVKILTMNQHQTGN